MTYELSSLDLHYLVEELQALKGARVDKIYQPSKKELLLQLFLSGQGKRLLRVRAPGFMYMSDYKEEQPERPSGFCTLLRKHLDGARFAGIAQLGFERIINLSFESKEEKPRLIFELFSKGNIVLCKDDLTIIMPAENQAWREREVRPRVKYTYPKKEYDASNMTADSLKDLSEKSNKSIVRLLAVYFGLGGTYAEEACLLAGISKEKIRLEEIEAKSLTGAIDQLIRGDSSPTLYLRDKAVVVISPIKLKTLEGLEKKEFKTYNEALDYAFTNQLILDSDERKLSGHEARIERLQRIIDKQEAQLREQEAAADEDYRKGEAIYSHYQTLTRIQAELNKARQKHSLKEIKEKLKGHKQVKDIKEKDKIAIVELE